jgi:uncharacterized protein YbjT (DUF2867 family)
VKIVVIGGTGLIGTKLVKNPASAAMVLPASPNTGVNTITREGLLKALDGAEVVVDVANAPVWEDKAVLEFFETSGRNLLAAEAAAGVRHHVALSIVGSERLPDNGYFARRSRRKAHQGVRHSLHHPACHAVLRVCPRHCPVGHRRR